MLEVHGSCFDPNQGKNIVDGRRVWWLGFFDCCTMWFVALSSGLYHLCDFRVVSDAGHKGNLLNHTKHYRDRQNARNIGSFQVKITGWDVQK